MPKFQALVRGLDGIGLETSVRNVSTERDKVTLRGKRTGMMLDAEVPAAPPHMRERVINDFTFDAKFFWDEELEEVIG